MSVPKHSQAELILAFMRKNGSISPLEALDEFGCFRLGARIYDLKKLGYSITSTTKADINGHRWASYSLIEAPVQGVLI
jgi:hypothetical protein